MLRIRTFEALGASALAVSLIWTTRGLTFLQDEWDFIQYRLNWDADAFLRPHNQHLLASDVLVYKSLFAVFGIDSFLPYRLAGIAVHILCTALLFELARRRVGTRPAALVALPVAVLGCGWYVVINPFNMQWTLSLAGLLGSALLLDREDRRYDVLIALLVLVALVSSSLGVAVAAGVGARLLLTEDGLRRLWTVLVPLAIYGAWYLAYGLDADSAPGYHLTFSPAFLFNVAASGAGAVAGVPLREAGLPLRGLFVVGSHLLVLAMAGLVAWVLARDGLRRHARLALPLAALVAFWVLLTISRGYAHLPYESHYAYAGAVMLLALAVELAPALRLAPVARLGVAAVLVVSVVLNTATLVRHSNDRRHASEVVRAEVGALERVRGSVPYDYRLDDEPGRAPSIVAGPLLASIDRLGSSPGLGPAELASASAEARAEAERVLAAGDVAGSDERGGAGR
jgi:hypothetical protein